MDRDKVIKTLENCVLLDDCRTCEYWVERVDHDCQIMKDALALLKEQEAVEPYVAGKAKSFEIAESWWYECGNCNKLIDPYDKYCRHCGRTVKWEQMEQK